MAKLKCEHARRVHVLKNDNRDVAVVHRNDGTACDKRYVTLDTMVFDPQGWAINGPAPTSLHALGPFITVGTVDDAKALAAKPKKRQIKKTKR